MGPRGKHEALGRLPADDPSIPAVHVQARRRAPRYAVVKQEHLVTLIEAGECTAFDDAIRFVLAAKAADIPIAAASSDAAVGVQAAKAGRMAALGVARLGDEQAQQALADAGADLVVRTLDEVSRPALAEGRLARKTEG